MIAKTIAESVTNLGVDPSLLDRAVRALLKHHAAGGSGNDPKSDAKQLFENDLDVQVQLSLARIPGNASPKPIRLELPHPLVKVSTGVDGMEVDGNLEEAEVCIIVKEESKQWVQEMVERFPNELGCVKKVLGLQSLRVKHKSFTQRRALLGRFDIFLADDRILPMLTKALGGKFFEKKKQPIPIQLTRKEALPFAVQKCLRSTFMHLSAGTCVTIKAGSTSMSIEKLISNIQSIVKEAPMKVPRKWQNIRSISVKTTASVALPIYNKTPEELAEIMYLARKTTSDEKESTEEKADDSKVKKKRKELVAASPLARALKKQKAAENEHEKEKSKKSEKKSKKAQLEEIDVDGKGASEVEETKKDAKAEAAEIDEKTPKKKKKKKSKYSKDAEKEKESLETSEEKKDEDSELKSAKKHKKTDKEATPDHRTSTKMSKESVDDKNESTDMASFIPSQKFSGSKKGFVFRRGKQGVGYYRDVLPVVDKEWLLSLGKDGLKGGHRSRSNPRNPRKRR